AQSTAQPIQATIANPPQIEVVRVKPIDPAAPKLRFQLSDGSVDLMKSFRLDGFDGVGGAWKIPSTDETFDARYGHGKTTGSIRAVPLGKQATPLLLQAIASQSMMHERERRRTSASTISGKRRVRSLPGRL